MDGRCRKGRAHFLSEPDQGNVSLLCRPTAPKMKLHFGRYRLFILRPVLWNRGKEAARNSGTALASSCFRFIIFIFVRPNFYVLIK
jgi:hypothetical protein